jgi:hypothetical protein
MRRKVRLYIGGQLADLNDDAFVLLNYATEDLSNPTVVRNSWSRQITLPGTPTNNTIFGHIDRSDRETQYGSDTTGVYFDATQRTPFELLDATGEVLESGYLKLDGITKREGIVSYSVTLYGGLGGFLYSLAYDDNGNKRTLADIKYTGSGAQDTELNFTINKTTVKRAWQEVTGQTSSYPLYDILNFAPCYNGLPGGTFDADKALARPDACGLPVPSGYYAQGGWSLVSMPEKHTDIEMKDLRSYLQRPVISMQKLITAICQSYNNGGYSVELDSTFFTSSNPYWSKAWMTLPMLDTLTLNISEQHYTGIDSDATSQTIMLSGGGVVATRYIVNVDITPVITGTSLTSSSFWYMSYWLSSTEGYQTWITYTVQLKNGSTVLDTKTVKISSDPSLASNVPAIDVVGYFSPTSSTRAAFGPQHPQATLEGYGADRVVITAVVNFAAVGTTTSGTHTNMVSNARNGGTEKSITYKFADSWDERAIASTAVRSGSVISKQQLLGSLEGTPADYLLSYCKLFGLRFLYDKASKQVRIVTRSTFYGTGEAMIDLTKRVNVSKEINIKPFAFDSRWYELSLEDVPSSFLQYYKTVYGKRYGAQRINTGFAFNADTKDLLQGNVYRSAAEVQAVSKYFVNLDGAYGGSVINYPSVFMDAGGKYSLKSSVDGGFEDFDVPALPQAVLRTYWGGNAPGYDLTTRLQFAAEDGSGVDGRNVLVFYDGFTNPQTYCGGLAVSDDIDEMAALNDNTPCWILNWGDFSSGDLVSRLPHFSRYLCAYNSGYSDVVYSWDFGVPAELRMPLSNYNVAATMYRRYWSRYLGDRYDDDSKVLTARVDLKGLQVGQDLLRLFYVWDGAIWSLNKISNHSLTTYDDTEVELVKVQDTGNYTATPPTPPVTNYWMYVSGQTSFDVSKAAQTLSLEIVSNVSWTATSSQNWLAVSSASGTGDATLSLGVAVNTGSERTATVTLHTTQSGVPDVVITVVQASATTYYLSASPSSFDFNNQPQTGTIAIRTNVERWELFANVNWITLSSGGGSGDADVTIEVDSNPGTTGRTATITLQTDGDEPVAPVTITVSQDAATPPQPTYELSAAPTYLTFDNQPGEQLVAVTANVAWTAASSDSWLLVYPLSGSSNETLYVEVYNNTGVARTGTITLHTTQSGVPDVTIYVSQDGEEQPTGEVVIWNPDKPGQTPNATISASTTGLNVKITTSGAWKITSNESWLHEYFSGDWQGSTAKTNYQVYCAADANTTGSQRVGTLTLSLVDSPATTATFTVTQNA